MLNGERRRTRGDCAGVCLPANPVPAISDGRPEVRKHPELLAPPAELPGWPAHGEPGTGTVSWTRCQRAPAACAPPRPAVDPLRLVGTPLPAGCRLAQCSNAAASRLPVHRWPESSPPLRRQLPDSSSPPPQAPRPQSLGCRPPDVAAPLAAAAAQHRRRQCPRDDGSIRRPSTAEPAATWPPRHICRPCAAVAGRPCRSLPARCVLL
mmetsp:Transcript_9143/g.27479  ORF Transcript_9143/g.27479 Transcript_9143/m.27479 type:complete len:208 (-) Transcript_9143:979-1602(-)